jgi:hypothetical protein
MRTRSVYTDNLWGQPTRFPLDFGGNPTVRRRLRHDGAFTASRVAALQARGFYNMTLKWFGSYDAIHGMPYTATPTGATAAVDMIYDLWPKTDGDDHITMFRKMAAGQIKGCVVWGRTRRHRAEPVGGPCGLQGARRPRGHRHVRDRDRCGRPQARQRHLPLPGVLARRGGRQRRQLRSCAAVARARLPAEGQQQVRHGAADALRVRDRQGRRVQPHPAKWNAVVAQTGICGGTATRLVPHSRSSRSSTPISSYGWNPFNEDFEAISATTRCGTRTRLARDGDRLRFRGRVREHLQADERRSCGGGTMWLYLDAYNTNRTTRLHTGQANWLVRQPLQEPCHCRPERHLRLSRLGLLVARQPPRALQQRRRPRRCRDNFQTPDSVARLFVPRTPARNYGAVTPTTAGAASTVSPTVRTTGPRADPHGRSPRPLHGPHGALRDAARGQEPGAAGQLRPQHPRCCEVGPGPHGTQLRPALEPTNVATNDEDYPAAHRKDPADFPLVLTSIRCVEHFQGGPITRNNSWNVDAEPYPWVEINSVDAASWASRPATRSTSSPLAVIRRRRARVRSRRTRATSPRASLPAWVLAPRATSAWVKGVVAIPWHWGDKGLSTGCRANDLCMDSFDANTRIPEYKACLCRIEPM